MNTELHRNLKLDAISDVQLAHPWIHLVSEGSGNDEMLCHTVVWSTALGQTQSLLNWFWDPLSSSHLLDSLMDFPVHLLGHQGPESSGLVLLWMFRPDNWPKQAALSYSACVGRMVAVVGPSSIPLFFQNAGVGLRPQHRIAPGGNLVYDALPKAPSLQFW